MSIEQVYGTINRNSTEIIKIALSEFEKNRYLDLRIWYSPSDGKEKDDHRPTRKGLTIKLEQLEDFKKAVDKAYEELAKIKPVNK